MSHSINNFQLQTVFDINQIGAQSHPHSYGNPLIMGWIVSLLPLNKDDFGIK